MLMSGYVLASVACDGLTVMATPLFFRSLLELRYPAAAVLGSCEDA